LLSPTKRIKGAYKLNNPFSTLTKKEWLLWLCSLFIVLVSNILAANFDPLTLIAALVGVTSLVFAAKGNVWAQVLMIVFSILYGIMSFRFGYNLGNTSPENSIRGATSAAPPFVYNRMSVSNWGYYGYIHAAVRAVAHDLYLDGTVFRSSPKYVNKYPVVGEWGYGFGLRYKRSELLFGLHYMTKEYTQQESMQCVGVLQLRHTF